MFLILAVVREMGEELRAGTIASGALSSVRGLQADSGAESSSCKT